MNTYFCEIGTKLCENIQSPKNTSLKLPPNYLKTIFNKPTDCLEVTNIINELKDKNGGLDKINSKTIKIMKNNIIIPLVHILNLCIDKSIWPDSLKNAEVIPNYKNGEKHNMSNYRPISLISNIAKIFEKIIYNRLYDFISKNNIISSQLFGFMKNRGI